jgi:hypothetical protein
MDTCLDTSPWIPEANLGPVASCWSVPRLQAGTVHLF